MSAARTFLDTNVLLYLLSEDTAKADASEVLLSNGGVISVQVLNEFASVASRKLQLPWPLIRDVLQTLSDTLDVCALTIETHQRGVAIAERYRVSLYDGLILAAAEQAGCDLIYSEDMHAGLVLDSGLTIKNPFA